MKFLLTILVTASFALFPLISSADKTSPGEMKKICMDGFMKDESKSSDPAAYKSFVEKLCDCSETKVVGKEVDQNDVMTAMGACMRVTLLSETMTALKDDEAVDEDKITTECTKEWKIFTGFKPKQGTLEKTCECSAKELMALDASKRTDEESLDKIGTSCAGKD